MRKLVANMKHYICTHIYAYVHMLYLYANVCNTFTTYVKVLTYLLTYLQHICYRCKHRYIFTYVFAIRLLTIVCHCLYRVSKCRTQILNKRNHVLQAPAKFTLSHSLDSHSCPTRLALDSTPLVLDSTLLAARDFTTRTRDSTLRTRAL